MIRSFGIVGWNWLYINPKIEIGNFPLQKKLYCCCKVFQAKYFTDLILGSTKSGTIFKPIKRFVHFLRMFQSTYVQLYIITGFLKNKKTRELNT